MKTRTKTQGPELEAKTDCKHRQSELEGCIFDIGPIASDKFARTMKDLEWYIEATYIYSCQPAIMTKTPETFPDPEMSTIIPVTGVGRPKKYVEMT